MSKILPVDEERPAAVPIIVEHYEPGMDSSGIPFLPEDIPFRFRLDVPCVWLGAQKGKYSRICDEESEEFQHIGQIPRVLEKEWRKLRELQELEMARKGKLSYVLQQVAEKLGGNLEKAKARIEKLSMAASPTSHTNTTPVGKAVGDSAEHSITEGFLRRDLCNCIQVLGLETAPGRPLCAEDLQNIPDHLEVTMIVDVKGDPLLKEVGWCDGSPDKPTIFKMLLLIYERWIEENSTDEVAPQSQLRFTYITSFDYAVLFPPKPYPSCRLKAPPAEEDVARLFPVAGEISSVSLFERTITAEATTIWLFWECFNKVFDVSREVVTEESKNISLLSTDMASLIRAKKQKGGISGGMLDRLRLPGAGVRKLKKCQGSRKNALRTLWYLVQPTDFSLAFFHEVHIADIGLDVNALDDSTEQFPAHILKIVQFALHKSAKKLEGDFEDCMPSSWESAPTPDDLGKEYAWPLEVAMEDDMNAEFKGKQPKTLVHSVKPPIEIGAKLYLVQCVVILRQPNYDRREHHRQEKPYYTKEYKTIRVCVDLSNIEFDKQAKVMSATVAEHWEIEDMLECVSQLEDCIEGAPGILLPERMAQLAYGLRALQRTSIQQQLRSVGLVASEVELPKIANADTKRQACSRLCNFAMSLLKCSHSRGMQDAEDSDQAQAQRIVFLTVPNGVLQQRAERAKMVLKLERNQRSGTFLSGFFPEQFLRGAPNGEFWVETPSSPYPYHPYFQASVPDVDPTSLLSPAERKFFVLSFISDPLSDTRFPDGSIDPRQGGANIDISELVSSNIVDSFIQLEDSMYLERLTNTFVFPWRHHGWFGFLFKNLFSTKSSKLLCIFGPQIASYFEFLTFLCRALIPCAVLGIFAQWAGAPNHPGSTQPWWKYIRPAFGLLMPVWGLGVCILWRRKVAYLTYVWNNGILVLGEELQAPSVFTGDKSMVRPEFAVRFRKSFDNADAAEQKLILDELREVLRVQGTSSAFSDKVLREDIDIYNEACYMKDGARNRRVFCSFCGTCLLVGLSILITTFSMDWQTFVCGSGGCKERHSKLLSYALSGITSGILVPVLSSCHRALAIASTEWEKHRDIRKHEACLFTKLFFFDFMNYFNSPLYIAFRFQNMSQLSVQLASLMFGLCIFGNFREIFLPWLAVAYAKTFEVEEDSAGDFTATSTASGPIKKGLRDVLLQRVRSQPFALIDELIELVVLFGLVSCFSVAFPLAPMFFFLSCAFEMRCDAYKLLCLQLFPQPRMTVGIGMSFHILMLISVISVFVNCAVLYFAKYEDDLSAMTGTGLEILLPEESENYRLNVLLVIEHVLLASMYLFSLVGKVNSAVRKEEFRQQYFNEREDTEYRRTAEAAHSSGMPDESDLLTNNSKKFD